MTTRSRPLAVAAAMLTAAALFVTTPTAPAAAARTGPVVPYLVEGPEDGAWVIHDGAATVPLPANIVDNSTEGQFAGEFHLLGAVPAGYVVSEHATVDVPGPITTSYELHLVARDGSANTFYSNVTEARLRQELLSDDGTSVFVTGMDEGNDENRIVSLQGTVQDLLTPWYEPTVLDFPNPRRMLVTYYSFESKGDRIVTYRPLRDREKLVARNRPLDRAVWGDIDADVLARSAKPKRRGAPTISTITRISRPRQVLWTARFSPQSVSPNGRWLVGTGGRAEAAQVRRVRDGKIVATLPKNADTHVAVWTSPRRMTLQAGSRIISCTVRGACRTVATPGGRVDLADVVIR